MAWQVYDAKARFSELLDATLKDGPQIVTRRGVETAELVSIDEWKRLRETARPNIKDILLDPCHYSPVEKGAQFQACFRE